MVWDSLCELQVRNGNSAFLATLAYESR
ncbi:Hok/Gef family protein [Vibrio sp. Y29_XK_CS5]|nr:Hok/Gef family protein [Vibrio sp. Y29_XK_CS5]